MATNLSTNTQVSFINSLTRAGTVLLPSSFTIPGRTLTFKDQVGALSTNFLTIATNNANQSIDTITRSTILTTPLGWQTYIAGNNNQWFTVGGSSYIAINTSTVNSVGISSTQVSTGNVLVSSLRFQDQTFTTSTNQLYATSTFLYYQTNTQSTIIAGTRQSFGGLFMTPSVGTFQPNQLTGLNLWFDAADPGTFATTTNNQLTAIFDKSGSGSSVLSFDGSSVIYQPTGFFGRPSFLMTNGHFRGSISTSRPLTRYTNTTFIVTQLISALGDGFSCMSIGERATGSIAGEVFYRNLDCTTLASQAFRQVGFFQTNTPVTVVTNVVGNTLIVNTNYSGAVNGNTLFTRMNGSTTGVTTANANPAPATNGLFFFIGSDGNSNSFSANMWNGRISEILMYNVQLNATQQQQVEGYLAWKWNLVSFLPAAHLYKNFPP